MFLAPPPLQAGDKIGVMAPSSYVEQVDIEAGAEIIRAKGFEVFIHPQSYARHGQSAGTVEDKIKAFHSLWSDPEIKCVWAAGGGNRTLNMIPLLDFELIRKTPKFLVGFSDVTALLNHITARTNIQTIHGPVFKNLSRFKEWNELISLLSGKTVPYGLDGKITKKGDAEGHLIGGNLSLFQYLPATLPTSYFEGAILFLEDCNIELSHIDRILIHLKNMGILKQANGLIFGEFSNTKDTGRPFGFCLEEIIKEHSKELHIPVITGASFGHGLNLPPFPIGQKVRVDTETRNLYFI